MRAYASVILVPATGPGMRSASVDKAYSPHRLPEPSNAVNHADDRHEADREQQQRHDQHQRDGKLALGVNKPVGPEHLAFPAEAGHVRDVVADPDGQHPDAEDDEHFAEAPRRHAALEDVGLVRLLEELKDREAEADQ